MPLLPSAARVIVGEVVLGAWLGLIVLGGGGRVVMRAIAALTDAPAAVSVGGTVTVLAAGAAAGAAGALLHALSRAMAARGAGGRAAVRVALFTVLLALVTARGLRGSPGPTAAFYPLVLVYEILLLRFIARPARQDGPTEPRPTAVAPTMHGANDVR